jgi:hypothetical protein
MKTRSDDALRPAHDFIPRISCTAPACDVNRINSAGSTACMLKSLKHPTNITLQLGKLVINAARRRPVHTVAKIIYHGKNYKLISLTPLYMLILPPCCIHRLSYNGIRHARLYVTCHTCTMLHPKLLISYTSLWFHYVFTATYMYRPICRARFEFSMLLNQC